MKDPTIRLTVKCPRCGRGTLAQLRIAVIAQAFILENPIRLHATCHDLWWDASYLERQELREHLIGMQFKAGFFAFCAAISS